MLSWQHGRNQQIEDLFDELVSVGVGAIDQFVTERRAEEFVY
jgi:hypothetical protein